LCFFKTIEQFGCCWNNESKFRKLFLVNKRISCFLPMAT
jgi:hypothetical protein